MAKKKTEEIDVLELVQLPKKKVTIKFNAKPTGMIKDPKHILYGGLGPRGSKVFQLARMQSGSYFDPFPSDEMRFAVEAAFGLPEGGLNPKAKLNNYFDNYIVRLNKLDMILDLSDPYNYLTYLVAIAQKEYVAPSKRHCTDKNLSRSSYMWYIEDDEVAAETKSKQISKTAEAWKEFGKIEDSTAKLRQIMIEHKGMSNLPSAANNHEWLHAAVGEIVENDAEVFVNYINDKTLPIKADIHEAVRLGILMKKSDGKMHLFFQEDESPLALESDINDISGAVRYLSEPENSDYYATVKQRIQNAK